MCISGLLLPTVADCIFVSGPDGPARGPPSIVLVGCKGLGRSRFDPYQSYRKYHAGRALDPVPVTLNKLRTRDSSRKDDDIVVEVALPPATTPLGVGPISLLAPAAIGIDRPWPVPRPPG